MNTGKVGVVVVTYNRLSFLQEEIESLRNQTYNQFQIVVVNNSSTDGTLEWLKKQDDIITITQANMGGAGGFFTGMKYVAENDYDYCWIMDDDVISRPNALEELVKAIKVKDNIGFVCSNVIGTEGSPMNTPIVDTISKSAETGYECYFELADASMVRVFRATFVSVLLKCEIIYKEGLPYKNYFIWGDDTEYTTRLSAKYACYVALKSTVMHKRVIQKTLSLVNENDKRRIQMHTLRVRNESYTAIAHKLSKRWKIIFDLYVLSLKCLLKFRVVESKMYMQSANMLYSFCPIIEYPNKRR